MTTNKEAFGIVAISTKQPLQESTKRNVRLWIVKRQLEESDDSSVQDCLHNIIIYALLIHNVNVVYMLLFIMG